MGYSALTHTYMGSLVQETYGRRDVSTFKFVGALSTDSIMQSTPRVLLVTPTFLSLSYGFVGAELIDSILV